MRRHPVLFGTAVVLLAAGGILTTLHADSWRLPTAEKYYSPNRKFRVVVVPRVLESQLKYFEDKVGGTEPAGVPVGHASDGPRASFGIRKFFWYRHQSTFPLVNDVSPVDLAISDRGDYVVTLDNWHSMGYGDSVIVIYRSDGRVIRQFALDELVTESDIRHFRHSTSSIHWRDAHRIDSPARQLVLLISSSEEELPSQWARTQELRIDLATGNSREPVRRLWPTREFVVLAGVAADDPITAGLDPAVCSDKAVTFGLPGVLRLSSRRFYDNAMDRATPLYPDIAKLARVQGRVVVELLVDESGSVRCSRVLAGPPLLIAAAVDAARRWKFAPLEGAPSGLAAGSIQFEFTMQWK
jgi:TonB family protein